MTVLITLGPLLAALLFGFWINIKIFTPSRVAKGLESLVYLILGLIGFSLGALENLSEKLIVAGYQAIVLLALISFFNLSGLYLSGLRFKATHTSNSPKQESSHNLAQVFIEAAKTLSWVIAGVVIGIFFGDTFTEVDATVTYLLYFLLFLIGCQLRQGNYRLRKLFLNPQGVIIALVAITTTLTAGLIGCSILELEWNHGLAVVSGFGWYSLSGILITGLGDPILGTTAFLLDLGREILILMLIPFLSRISSHISVGFSGATAMDFTLPMLGKFHGADIVPICISSGLIMSLLVPILIPLFLGFSH
ncbi:LysO family transporter [Marinomonas sp. C2222]|uniref:LysO family transporter n=1 Tax=Marinomonas sargassi TaxID=2984494 RepID=A0ABT2YPR6_9GAMM|nr:LysO family transporter [Marinomonas sargassi]MCV2401890.1 LysO family transporter [Marinomonas sargassi]